MLTFPVFYFPPTFSEMSLCFCSHHSNFIILLLLIFKKFGIHTWHCLGVTPKCGLGIEFGSLSCRPCILALWVIFWFLSHLPALLLWQREDVFLQLLAISLTSAYNISKRNWITVKWQFLVPGERGST